MNKDGYYNETTAEYIARRRADHLGKLIVAAQAACDLWDKWKNLPYTVDFTADLRKAIEEAKK